MRVAIIDYGSGNLQSAKNAFLRAAREEGISLKIELVNDAGSLARADRIVLPGVGAYADCRAGLEACDGMIEAIEENALKKAKPFLGICVGMQLMATCGFEKKITSGFGWIDGEVKKMDSNSLKIPHIGWNNIYVKHSHPLLDGIKTGADGLHAYFVHSYFFNPKNPQHILAVTDYGGEITAVVGRDNLVGAQFHPEKSQKLGLSMISNFLRWNP